ncbi:MAG TPA: hypothetical protein VGR71_14755, partial [Nitrospira sp.]|nr:hypothetical protein [Nitrospira sp.]
RPAPGPDSVITPPAFYLNAANPGPASSHWLLPGPKQCFDSTSASDPGCAYNYGWSAADQAFDVAAAATSQNIAAEEEWWIDVETTNSWDGNFWANGTAIEGYRDLLRTRGVARIGIYSTAKQWKAIAGNFVIADVFNWLAGAPDLLTAPGYCGLSFTGGPVQLVQFASGSFDADYDCLSIPR